MTARRLLFSIHDVAPSFEREIDQLLAVSAPHVGRRLAMLVVPAHWNSAPLVAGSAFASRLREWADEGIEMFLHGWRHLDEARHETAGARIRAARMTAGEGEFLGLDEVEARRRLQAGRGLVEDIIGRPVAGFIAPAWLYGPGAMAAIGEEGFALAEDHWRVWVPSSGRTLLRSPVITWASRTPARLRSSLMLAGAVRHLPMPATMRVAVHPGDARHPVLVESITRTLGALGHGRPAAAYSDLLQAAMS
ncbi:MAG: polysaccharide deacetylase family protein [Sphingomicrobium sp.]